MEQFIIIMSVIIILLVVLLICIVISNNFLVVRRHIYKSKKLPDELDGKKILHISDLHSKRFGKDNIKLINKIITEEPDYIFMTGDIVNKKEVDISKFLSELKEIFSKYTVFYSMGNHERLLGYEKYKDYIQKLKKYGVHVLLDSNVYIGKERNVNIVGLNYKSNIRDDKEHIQNEEKYISYLKEKIGNIDDTKFNILLSHDALNFKMYAKMGYDLVFSGHVHGGLIRIFKLGLLSPRGRFFPRYCVGKYKKKNTTMFVSTGMGKASIPIRLFNPPEILVVELKRK